MPKPDDLGELLAGCFPQSGLPSNSDSSTAAALLVQRLCGQCAATRTAVDLQRLLLAIASTARLIAGRSMQQQRARHLN